MYRTYPPKGLYHGWWRGGWFWGRWWGMGILWDNEVAWLASVTDDAQQWRRLMKTWTMIQVTYWVKWGSNASGVYQMDLYLASCTIWLIVYWPIVFQYSHGCNCFYYHQCHHIQTVDKFCLLANASPKAPNLQKKKYQDFVIEKFEWEVFWVCILAFLRCLLEKATAATWHERVQLESQLNPEHKLLVTFVDCPMCTIPFHQNHLSFFHIDSLNQVVHHGAIQNHHQ